MSFFTKKLCAISLTLLMFAPLTQAQSSIDIDLFTDQERQWIKDHPVISVGIDAHWPPIDFINETGQHQGITRDYIDILSKTTGIKFSTTAADGWSNMLDKAKQRQIDIVASFAKRADREKYWLYTDSYFQAPYVIATRKDEHNITDLASLYGKTVAIEKGYYLQSELEKHAEIKLYRVKDSTAALQAVSREKADAYIGNQAVIFYLTEKYRFTNVKVAADSPYPANNLYFGIRSDWGELVSIINKTLRFNFEENSRQIEHKWLGMTTQSTTKFQLTPEEQLWLQQHEKLSVGVMDSWPPISKLNENNQLVGIDIDIIHELEKRLGKQLTIVSGSWDKIYQDAKQKKLDLIMGITPKPFRKEFFEFSSPYMSVPHIIVAQKNIPEFYDNEKDLAGKTLALEQDFINVDYFKTNYPETRIKTYSNTLEALEAVSRGDADAYSGSRIVVLYLIEKHLISNLKIHGRLSKKATELAIGSRKDYPILHQILQKSLADINSTGIREIVHTWVSLFENTTSDFNLELTEQEKIWLSKNPSLKVGIMSGWPPFNFVDENGSAKGIGVDIIDQINLRLNNLLTIVPGEWKDIYQNVKDKKLDLLLDITPKKEREPYFNFTTPYLDVPHIIIANKNTPFISSESELNGKILALEKGFGNVKYFKQNHPDISLQLYNNTAEALEAVSRGEAHAYAGNRVVALYLIEKLSLANLNIHARLLKSGSILAIGTRKDLPILKDIIQKALDKITPHGIRNIKNSWIYAPNTRENKDLKLTKQEKFWLKKHPEITLGVDSAWVPLEYMDKQSEYQGLSSDYMKHFSQQLGITFKAPENLPWLLVVKSLKEKTIDLAPMVQKTEKRSQYLNFTAPYQHFPLVLFNRRGENLLSGLMGLQGKKLGVANGYAVTESLSKDYPDLQQVLYPNTQLGLEALSVGEIDAFIDVLAVGGYLMADNGLSNIQVASSTPYTYHFSIGVRKDWPELIPILNKAINKLSAEKKNEFLQNWLVLPAQQKNNYTLLYWVLSIALVILVLLFIRAREMTRVNKKLKESRERLSLSLESAKLGTWELSFEENQTPIFKYDKNFALQHQIPTDQLIQKSDNFYQYIAPEYIKLIKKTLTSYVKGNINDLALEYMTYDTKHWISSQGRIFERNANGWAHRIVGISQEITDTKASQLAVEKSNQFKSQFLANMSHEIRTPMNAIVGLGHLLSRTEISSKQADYINNIHKSSQTLLALIDDILDLSKIEAGHLNIENIEFSLEELLSDQANLSVIRINKEVEFIYDMGTDVPDLLIGDAFRINQVLTNLISNSIKFTETGSIVLSVHILKDIKPLKNKIWLLFSITDTGIGIASNKLKKLFDPFIQEDGSTTRKYGGTGLGLSISRQLINLMGGTLEVDSIQGTGSKFYFKLPFACNSSSRSSCLTKPDPDLRGLKVLLIDDNPLSLKILSETLESMTFSVTALSSGQQAIDLLQDKNTGSFEVILLDWRMPGMNGEVTASNIRKLLPKEKHTSIILMTAYGRDAAEQNFEPELLDGFMVKPITPSQLFDTIIQVRQSATPFSPKAKKVNNEDKLLVNSLSGHILLAEDNLINQQVAQEILQQMGLQVSICENGKEVLASLEQQIPDLILMDIQMHEMDGYQATIKIRRDGRFDQLPIIAMTANAMAKDINESIQSGMNGHISKPVDPILLYNTLSEYLPKKQQSSPTIIENHSEPTSSRWPDNAPGLNIKKGIQQVGGNETLYKKLLTDFLKNHKDTDTDFKQALAQSDLKKAARIMHTIKGVSSNIGANKLHEISTIIDETLTKGEGINASLMSDLKASFMELSQSLDTLSKNDNQYPENKHDNELIEKPVTDNKDINISKLLFALESGDARSLEVFQQLSAELSAVLTQKQQEKLLAFIHDYDFDLALTYLTDAMGDNIE